MTRPSNHGILRRLHRSESGAAMLELVVVLPVLILIAIGVMDYGRVYFTSVAVANAARAGAEYGTAQTANQNDSINIVNFAKLDGAEVAPIDTVTEKTFYMCGSTLVLASDTCPGYGPPQVYVQVRAKKLITLLLHYPGLPATVWISRTATFRLQ